MSAHLFARSGTRNANRLLEVILRCCWELTPFAHSCNGPPNGHSKVINPTYEMAFILLSNYFFKTFEQSRTSSCSKLMNNIVRNEFAALRCGSKMCAATSSCKGLVLLQDSSF